MALLGTWGHTAAQVCVLCLGAARISELALLDSLLTFKVTHLPPLLFSIASASSSPSARGLTGHLLPGPVKQVFMSLSQPARRVPTCPPRPHLPAASPPAHHVPTCPPCPHLPSVSCCGKGGHREALGRLQRLVLDNCHCRERVGIVESEPGPSTAPPSSEKWRALRSSSDGRVFHHDDAGSGLSGS